MVDFELDGAMQLEVRRRRDEDDRAQITERAQVKTMLLFGVVSRRQLTTVHVGLMNAYTLGETMSTVDNVTDSCIHFTTGSSFTADVVGTGAKIPILAQCFQQSVRSLRSS